MPDLKPVQDDRRAQITSWKAIVAEYEQPVRWRACWQIINSVGSYIALWVLMYFAIKVSWWLVVPLAVLASGIVIRCFIIFHDCGHGSFFRSKSANDFWGYICGIFTFTPYYHWRWEHARHHGTSGDLDRRGVGDIWTLTVQEYLESSRWRRFAYRLARNPIVLFVVAPFVVFVGFNRFAKPAATGRERHSVWAMNLAILGTASILCLIYGVVPYLIIQGIIMAVSGGAGIWLFYVQHQFEDVYWEHGEQWDYTAAAIEGSSFYKLPKVLQWFTGNIGYHHIHHLSPRIPNYNLERCHKSEAMFQQVKPLTFWSSFKTMRYRLFDEASRKLVGFREIRHLPRLRKAG